MNFLLGFADVTNRNAPESQELEKCNSLAVHVGDETILDA